METKCQKCGKANILFRCGNAICESCGYEITVDRHFANLMAESIVTENKDGLDRSDYRLRLAVAFLSATKLQDDFQIENILNNL